jgi:PAS domain S-box-containing protein
MTVAASNPDASVPVFVPERPDARLRREAEGAARTGYIARVTPLRNTGGHRPPRVIHRRKGLPHRLTSRSPAVAHTATIGLRAAGRTYAKDSFRLRLRFAGALVLLVLPLVGGAWAFGNYAAANERSQTDTRLDASLRATASEYARVIDDAQVQAMQLATSHRLQRALETRDHRELERLRKENPNAQLLVGKRAGAAAAPGVVQRSIDVFAGDRVVGSVVVKVALDNAVLAQIAREAGLPGQQEIAVAERGGRVVAASRPLSGVLALAGTPARTVQVGGSAYRAVSAPLAPATRIGILAPNDAVDDAAATIRGRILLIGILALGIVMLLAYALAPALARARVAEQQRAIAERVLAHVADGVFLVDPQGIVQFWNRAAETLTGVTADQALGGSAEQAIPGWEAAAPQIPVGDAHELNGNAASATVPLETDAGELWMAASGVRFADGTVYTFRDITEDERLDQAKTDFVATVSHELRTPLASVYGAALTLRERFSTLDVHQRNQLLQLLAEQAKRLSSIIDELLLASSLAGRLDSRRFPMDHDSFDADVVARAVVQAAQVHAPSGIEIELSTPPWLPDATGDSDKVGQVLANLVENAVKYSPAGGRIDVVLTHDGDRIRFVVRDQGLGIPLDEQERIFKKFYRLDPNLTRGIGGTGLGLYISHELVRRMGGEISVSSTPGHGSTFSFDLPITSTPDRIAEPVGSA